MHNGKDGRSRAVSTHGLLQEGIGTGVNGSGGFVQQQDLGAAEDSTGQTQELTLADGVVGAVVSNDSVELVLLAGDEVLETNQLESVPEGSVIVATFKVQSGADGSREDEWIYPRMSVNVKTTERGLKYLGGSVPYRGEECGHQAWRYLHHQPERYPYLAPEA